MSQPVQHIQTEDALPGDGAALPGDAANPASPVQPAGDVEPRTESVCPQERPNRRAVFRVPVAQSSKLAVTLAYDGLTAAGTVTNIGLSGVSVEVPPLLWHRLSENTQVSVTLRLPVRRGSRIDVTYAGIVRSSRKGVLGIQFPGHVYDGEIDPPDAYRTLVMEMQREFNLRRHMAFKVV